MWLLHRTNATLIGLLKAGRADEWVVMEKLDNFVKMKSSSNTSAKTSFMRQGQDSWGWTQWVPSYELMWAFCSRLCKHLVHALFLCGRFFLNIPMKQIKVTLHVCEIVIFSSVKLTEINLHIVSQCMCWWSLHLFLVQGLFTFVGLVWQWVNNWDKLIRSLFWDECVGDPCIYF